MRLNPLFIGSFESYVRNTGKELTMNSYAEN